MSLLPALVTSVPVLETPFPNKLSNNADAIKEKISPCCLSLFH